MPILIQGQRNIETYRSNDQVWKNFKITQAIEKDYLLLSLVYSTDYSTRTCFSPIPQGELTTDHAANDTWISILP